MRDFVEHLNVSPSPASSSSSSFIHLTHLPFCVQDCDQTCEWRCGEGRGASSALGSDEAVDGDMEKATSRVHTKSTGATMGAKAARGKAARAEAS
jgi:hypothetical protein